MRVSDSVIEAVAHAIRYTDVVTTAIRSVGHVTDADVRSAIQGLRRSDPSVPNLGSPRSLAMVHEFLTEF